MYKSRVCTLSILRRPHVGNDLLSWSTPIGCSSYGTHTPVHSVHVLAAILALSILGAGSALAGQIPGTIQGIPVTVPSRLFPSPQITNGTLNIGAGKDGTLNILTGGQVTVGGAKLGVSPNATGTVKVTGPDAIFSTQARDIEVGVNGTGILAVDDGLVQTAARIVIEGTGNITAVRGARIVSQTNGITVEGTGVVSMDNSTLTAETGDAFLVEGGGATATISINNVNDTIHAGSGGNL